MVKALLLVSVTEDTSSFGSCYWSDLREVLGGELRT